MAKITMGGKSSAQSSLTNHGKTVSRTNAYTDVPDFSTPEGAAMANDEIRKLATKVNQSQSTVVTQTKVGNAGNSSNATLPDISSFSGTSGYSGHSGFSGYSGYSGERGLSGYSGLNGAASASGFSGASGYSGWSGYSGVGIVGPQGPDGVSGFSGWSGFSGLNGAAAASGWSGFSGTSGYSGISGWSGKSGYSGIGISGFSGFSGMSGYSGLGISGYSGYSGYGMSGFSGLSGYSGMQGLQGLVGGVSIPFYYTSNWALGLQTSYVTVNNANPALANYIIFSTTDAYGNDVKTALQYLLADRCILRIFLPNNPSQFHTYYCTNIATHTNYIDMTAVYTGGATNTFTNGTTSWIGVQNYGVSGLSGWSGFSGKSGFSGYGMSGFSGLSGYSGWSGISGFSGTGPSGFSGYSGWSGMSGFSGLNGAASASGFSGASGISGFSGFSGYSGLGTVGGFSIPYLFDTTTGAGPAANHISANSSSMNLVSHLYANIYDVNGYNTWTILSQVVSGSKLKLFTSSSQYQYYTVNSTTLNVSTIDIAVTYESGSTTAYANNTPLWMGLSIKGSAGSAGSQGASGYSGWSGIQGFSGFSGFSGVANLQYWTESRSTTAPNDTVHVTKWSPITSSTYADAVVSPKGAGAFLLQTPDSTTAGGNKRGVYAVDLQTYRDNAASVAGGQYSSLLGGFNNRIDTTAEMSAILGGYVNQVTTPYGTILGGQWAKTLSYNQCSRGMHTNNGTRVQQSDFLLNVGTAGNSTWNRMYLDSGNSYQIALPSTKFLWHIRVSALAQGNTGISNYGMWEPGIVRIVMWGDGNGNYGGSPTMQSGPQIYGGTGSTFQISPTWNATQGYLYLEINTGATACMCSALVEVLEMWA